MAKEITLQEYMELAQADGLLFKSMRGDILTLDSYGSDPFVTEDDFDFDFKSLGTTQSVDSDRIRLLTISTNDVDRKLDRLDSRGMKVENFKRNPLFLYEHGFGPGGPLTDPKKILGRINGIEMHDDKVIAEAMFVPMVHNPLPEQILELETKSMIPGNSIGWRPLDKITIDDKGIRDIGIWELIEVSKVVVPVNGKATNLQVSH